MHRADAIYSTKYGCFLQAFQVHLKRKRISGDPAKRNAQSQCELLSLTEEAIRRFLFERFLKAGVTEIFSREEEQANSERALDLGNVVREEVSQGVCRGQLEGRRVCFPPWPRVALGHFLKVVLSSKAPRREGKSLHFASL